MHDDIRQPTGETDNGVGGAPAEAPRPSMWRAGQKAATYPALDAELSVDVAIIGAGITGITAAARLARAGRSVAVLEARRIGSGTTGHATGNLYALVEQGLYRLAKKWGKDVVEAIVRSRADAVDLIESNTREYQIACDFARTPWVLYGTTNRSEESREIENEYKAARGVGLDARLVNDLPLPYLITKALVVRDQAQFNPLAYVRGLAAAIHSGQCRIFEETPVVDIDPEAGVVRTAAHTVTADHIVMATHTPKGFSVVQTELGPYREYAVAAPIEEFQLPGGIFWSAGEKPTSTRAVEMDGVQYVLMIGESHKTGQNNDPGSAYQRLEDLLRTRFLIRDPAFRWSAQNYRAADGLPYIGSSSGASRVYIATGFATDGLTYGTLAGMLIADEIEGRQNPFAELYSPRRFTPMKSARNFLKENLNVAGRYVKDYTQSPPLKNLSELAPDEGGLVELADGKMAAYRDRNSRLHLLSPVCTHLKCIVHWNRAERSWDCPCHGSRFDYDGRVIEGPALLPLQRQNEASVGDSGAGDSSPF